MLRALGVAFIICCCFFAGLLGLGIGYVVLKTDVVDRLLASSNTRPRESESASETDEVKPPLSTSGNAQARLLDGRVHPVRYEPPENIAETPLSETISLEAGVRSSPAMLVASAPDTTVIGSILLGQTQPVLEPSRIVEVAAGNWKWRSGLDRPLLLPSNATDVQLTIEPISAEGFSKTAVDAAFANITGAVMPSFSGTPVLEPSAGTSPINRLVLTYTGLSSREHQLGFLRTRNPVTMRVQDPASVGTPPRFSEIANGLYQARGYDAAVIGNSKESRVAVYRGFLRIAYDAPTDRTNHTFCLVQTDENDSPVDSVQVTPTPSAWETMGDGRYAATFQQLSFGSEAKFGRLYVLSQSSRGVSFSTPLFIRDVTPTKEQVVASFQIKASAGVKQANDKTQYALPDIAVFTSAVDPKGADNIDLLLLNDSGTKVLDRKRLDKAQAGPLELTIPNPDEGPQTVQIAAYQGATPLSLTDDVKPISISVLRNGPKLDHYDLEALTQDPHGKSFALFFSKNHPLDQASAENVGSYTFKAVSPSTADPSLAATQPLKFNPSNNSVTITFANALPPGEFVFTVNHAKSPTDTAGIKGILGHPLNAPSLLGVGSSPDIKFLKIVGPTGESIATSPTAGLKDSNAEYIRYGEYTKPRELIDGFNPSDKVITRVARLYYFRDAHRVTQIINRKAKSYNRQAVDVAQQLADQSRRVADSATDARKDIEMKAVRAAQHARESENTLRDQQQKLIEARQKQASLPLTQFNTQNDIDKLTQQKVAAQDQYDQAIQAQKKANDDRNALKLGGAQPNDPQMKSADAEFFARTAAANAAKINLESVTRQVGQLQVTKDSQAAELASLPDQIIQLEGHIRSLMSRVQADRDTEITATERWEDYDRKEQRSREEQFRREVAAKSEDPDTYAPGYPQSEDPVEQVSISVIGEGLIQLRGPRKGVNIVHTMINELDAPVGQVRVALHTVQINGEHGDRMEKVAERIQRYIDHSRFLTTQSAQYLRNAVVIVASRKAEEINLQLGDCPPDERQYRYREAFFGKDFLDELRELDSEFLRADNKVLSLHSMDTTSLASALFLIALAKNDTREEILMTFEGLVRGQLPYDEKEYFKASAAKKWVNFKPFHFSAQNARFVNLRGCFANEGAQPDTLNPCQREFIRLAQIFKARLVTEVELRQRVMERALIEERIGKNYLEESRRALEEEELANQAVKDTSIERLKRQQQIVTQISQMRSRIDSLLQMPEPRDFLLPQTVEEILQGFYRRDAQTQDSPKDGKAMADASAVAAARERYLDEAARVAVPTSFNTVFSGCRITIEVEMSGVVKIKQDDSLCLPYSEMLVRWEGEFLETIKEIRNFHQFTHRLRLDPKHRNLRDREEEFQKKLKANGESPWSRTNLAIVSIGIKECRAIEQHVKSTIDIYLDEARKLAAAASRPDADLRSLIADWTKIKRLALAELSDPLLQASLSSILQEIDNQFQGLIEAETKLRIAQSVAAQSRRRLDHKKFLDMLVDDVEEKFIELVEGTRSHTANVDNYVGRIATALESDFNTQFYYPAFKYVRETSQYWDVQVGQVETTSILANNRSFAKVSPQATMEFDLPKRDILINEAFSSALAAYNDYGALLNDPQFLALAKMYGGQPASHTYGGGLPAPMVRDVLPGLPSQTDAQFLSQAENNVPKIGANLEALIPDPAVYKFETGTGYEIRPTIQPDGQAVVFHLNYMYSTNIREPVRADEKHLGRIKRHFIDTDVQLANYELREVSRYTVALKASRTSRGVPLLEDVPVAGLLFRPLPQQESSLQQNLILAQTVIYPTLFDLMGLRWAPAVADLGTMTLQEREFVTRNREKLLRNEVFDYSSLQVDDFLRVPEGERRGDLYRTQESIPVDHPNGYFGRGMNFRQGELREGYDPRFHNQGTPATTPPVGTTPVVPHLFQNRADFGRPQPTDVIVPPPTLAPPNPSAMQEEVSPSDVIRMSGSRAVPQKNTAPPPPPSRPQRLPSKTEAQPIPPSHSGAKVTNKSPTVQPVSREVVLEPEKNAEARKPWFLFGRKNEVR